MNLIGATPRLANRHGQGMVVLLAGLALGILAIIGIQQTFFASQLTSQASRVSSGSIATALADSAINEALWRFETQVNDPSSALFGTIRQEVLAPRIGAFKLGKEFMPEELLGILDRAHFRSYKLEKLSAEVVYQRQFEDLPFERFGTVRFLARVSASPIFGPGVVREVELAKGFKVALGVVPRPFDQATFFLGSYGDIVDSGRVNSRRLKYLKTADEIAGWLQTAASSAPGGLTERYQRLRKTLDTPEQRRKAVPELCEDSKALVYGRWTGSQSFPLETLDVEKKLDALEAEAAPALARVRQSQEALSATTSDASLHERFLADAESALAGVNGLMRRIWSFHWSFTTIASSDPAYATVSRRMKYLRLEHWKRLAFFHIREGAGLGSVNEQFARLTKQLDPLNGIVLVENRTEPLVLSHNLKGKLVVVVTAGGAVLDGANGGDREQDLLTVVSLGGPVTISGEVHASVVTARAEEGTGSLGALTIRPGTKLRGGLILERLPRETQLAGRLYCSGKFYSGITGPAERNRPKSSHYIVGVSPAAAYRKVTRN